MKVFTSSLFTLVLLITNLPLFGQLQFDSFLFEGYNSPFLDNASSISISPSQEHLYISSYDDDAISLFQRNLNSGEITFIESYKNNIAGVSGLSEVNDIAVSPDGKHLYAAGQEDSAIAVFERDIVTGKLQFLYAAGNIASQLNGVHKIQLTKDGNYLFTISTISNTLSIFKRNVLTGTLSLQQEFKDGQGGVNDLTYPIDLSLSEDEVNLYVISLGDNAISTFSRNIMNGELTYEGSNDQLANFSTAKSISVSPKGDLVLAGGEHSIIAFQRNTYTGELAYQDTYLDNVFSNTIAGIADFYFSANGKYVLTASTQDNAITAFEISETTGVLSEIGVIINGQDGASGLTFPVNITGVSETDQVYIAGFGSNAITLLSFDEGETGDVGFINSANTASFGGLNGTAGAKDICISPDGAHAYVAGELDDALTIFSCDPQSGRLTHLGTLEDGSDNDGINGINTILSSPDGAYIYATGYWDHSIAIFERSETTGLLTYIDRVKDNFFGTDGLSGVRDIVTTTDGAYLYSAAFLESGIGTFERNESDGLLAYNSVVKDGVAGVDGLSNVIDLAISPDDNYLYAAANGEAAISTFQIDTQDGSLEYIQTIKNVDQGISGLEGISAITFSPEGNYIFAVSNIDNAIVQFSRDIDTGLLTFVGQYQNLFSENNTPLLAGASDIEMSPNGKFLFITAKENGTVSSLSYNESDGTIVLVDSEEDDLGSVNGLGGASSVAFSPTGNSIYVSGETDNAIAVFSCTINENIEETICEGEVFSFGNELLEVSGIYEKVEMEEGCTTVTKLVLTVIPSVTYIEKTICNGDEVFVGGESHSATGIYSYTVQSTNGCDSIVELNLTAVDAFPETVENTTLCAGEVLEWNGQSLANSGQYEAVLASSFGCDSIVKLNLEILPELQSTQMAVACASDFYVFGTSNYISSGQYTHVFDSQTGCDSTVVLDLIFATSSYTQDAVICEGDVFQFGNQIVDTPGEYVGEVLLSNGCIVEVQLTLEVQPMLSSTTVAVICEGDFYVFDNAVYTQSGEYSVQYPTANGCDSVAQLILSVYPTQTVEEVSICEGETYEFNGENYSDAGDYIVSFDSENGCDSTVTLSLIVAPLEQEINDFFCQGSVYEFEGEVYTEEGVYTQIITDSSGCEINYTLFLEQLSVIDVVENITNDSGNEMGAIAITEVVGGDAPYHYEWSTGETTAEISNLPNGFYTLTITDANGCYSVFEYEVSLLSSIGLLENIDFSLQLMPNLVSKGGIVYLHMQSEERIAGEIILIDNAGHEEIITTINIGIGETRHHFEAPQVAGLYYVQLKTREGVKVLKMSVTN